MSRLALYLLGSPRIECDGQTIKIDRRKAMALLFYLALARPGPGKEEHRRTVLAQ